MRKNYKLIVLSFILIFLTVNYGQAISSQDQYIEKNGVALLDIQSYKVDGKVRLTGSTEKEKIKILIQKGDKQLWLDVDLKDGKFDEEIWLVEGKGIYNVAIVIHEYDRKYSYGPRLTLTNKKEVNKYLVPTKHIESNEKEIIKIAEQITIDKETDRDKAEAIYDWVTENIEYDYKKYGKHKEGNYDSTYGALNTLKTKTGVCYDYATLSAGLGRALGLQVKVIKGEGINGSYRGLHAWNEFYISEEDAWINVDTTFGAIGQDKYFDNDNFNENHIKTDEY